MYEVPSEKYSAERIIKILLNPKIEGNRICKKRPVDIDVSSTFVIDLNSLKDPDDVKKDNFGVWHHSGSHNQIFECCFTADGDVQIGRSTFFSSEGQWEQYSLHRLQSKHLTNKNFRRMLSFITGNHMINIQFFAGILSCICNTAIPYTFFAFVHASNVIPLSCLVFLGN